MMKLNFMDIQVNNHHFLIKLKGSHTFPKCFESIFWYIINKAFGASQEELDWFTKLYHDNPEFLGDGNYRETQKYTKNALFYFKKK